MIWLTFVTATDEIRLPFLADEELPVFASSGKVEMVRVENVMPGAMVEGRGTVIWCDYPPMRGQTLGHIPSSTEEENTDPVGGFWEQIRFDNP